MKSSRQLRRKQHPPQPLNAVPEPPKNGELSLDHFYAYMPLHKYMCSPTREFWPAGSVNARFRATNGRGEEIKASLWLDEHRHVEQLTWYPHPSMLFPDRIVSDGGWTHSPGCNVLNLYCPPLEISGDPRKAARWQELVRYLFGYEAAEHIEWWLGHRVQRPYEKVNHAIAFVGDQGIGKDTILEPLKYGVGRKNFVEITPVQLLGPFNGFAKSVILRISEARDLGDIDRYAFYEHLKIYTAAPPDVLRCNEKNIREYSVINVCGVVITSNHKSDGIYLPADDRRHFVARSDRKPRDFRRDYFNRLYRWYKDEGGYGHVVEYLRSLDISRFDPKAPPPKTDAFWAIVNANQAPEDSEVADAIDKMGRPAAVTLEMIIAAEPGLAWLQDRHNRRRVTLRMEKVGYDPVRNDTAADGLFKIRGRRQVIYARRELTPQDRLAAIRLVRGRP